MKFPKIVQFPVAAAPWLRTLTSALAAFAAHRITRNQRPRLQRQAPGELRRSAP
jgi:hypothetical protein